jgi:hypothetical protein
MGLMCSNGFAASPKGRDAWRFFAPAMGISDRSTGRVRPERYLRPLGPRGLRQGRRARPSKGAPAPATPPELARLLLGGETDGPRYGQGRDTKLECTPSNRVPRDQWSGERFAESGLLPGDSQVNSPQTEPDKSREGQ